MSRGRGLHALLGGGRPADLLHRRRAELGGVALHAAGRSSRESTRGRRSARSLAEDLADRDPRRGGGADASSTASPSTSREGETFAIAGESGSGKSMTALALMGLLPRPAARVAAGRALLPGDRPLRAAGGEMRRRRGGEIAMIFQEPMTSLNPVMRVGTPDRRGDQRPSHDLAARTRARRDRAARPRCASPSPRAGSASIRTSFPAAAAAGDDRHGARRPAEAADRRRADHRPRRHGAGADPALLRDLQRRDRRRGHPDHPRHGRGRRDGDRVLVMRDGRKVEEAPVARALRRARGALHPRAPRRGARGSDRPRACPTGRFPPAAPVCEVRGLTVSYAVRRRPASPRRSRACAR